VSPFNCPKNRQGEPIVRLSADQREEICGIVRRDDCGLFLHYLDFIASSYAFHSLLLKNSQLSYKTGGPRTVRYASYKRGRPKDFGRIRMARCVATAYKATFKKRPAPSDNTRFNKIMAIVFDAAGCATGEKERRKILQAATSE